jgi:beta-N-acetylhexosaminidase
VTRRRTTLPALLVVTALAGVETPAGAACEALTPRQRVMQLVMTGIPGTSFNATTARLITRHAGSVILMGDNVQARGQLRRLTRALHRRADPVRLLVAMDEEGGRVSRLGEEGLGPRLPSARTMAGTMRPGGVRRIGKRVGRAMRRVGVDWNLAPVLDVTNAPANGVIGDRSFGGNPGAAARYGSAFARGLASTGVISTGKHFPGHGRTSVDSHRGLPTVRASLGNLRRRDLRPYRKAGRYLDAVMSAHIRFTALDRRRPATLSPEATGLLRETVRFDGVWMTDDLRMGAITGRWSVPDAAELAVAAGIDLVLVTGWSLTDEVADRLEGALTSGRLEDERVNEAATRVLALKGYSSEQIGCLLV